MTRQPHILWADDEIDILKPHILFLEGKDYKVTGVNSGNEALEDGYVGDDYYDVIHMLIPQYALDVDSTLPIPGTLELDSIELSSITLFEITAPETIYTPEELGLEIVCNLSLIHI